MFRYRAEAALAGRPHEGPLPETLEVYRQRAGPAASEPSGPPPVGSMGGYVVLRMRALSRILEPDGRVNPFAHHWRGNAFGPTLFELPDCRDARHFAEQVRRFWDDRPEPGDRLCLLTAVLPWALRGGDDFARDLLARAAGIVGELYPKSTEAQVEYRFALEGGLMLAGRFGDATAADVFYDQTLRLLRDAGRWELDSDLFAPVVHCLLRAVTPAGAAARLEELEALAPPANAHPPLERLVCLLPLAAGWGRLGQTGRATALLDQARPWLSRTEARPHPVLLSAVCRYFEASGHLPPEEGWPRIRAWFDRPPRLTDRFTTAPYYSRWHLNVAEAAVLAAAGAG
jgi:hypothetical protein